MLGTTKESLKEKVSKLEGVTSFILVAVLALIPFFVCAWRSKKK